MTHNVTSRNNPTYLSLLDFFTDGLKSADGISSALKIIQYSGRWIQFLPFMKSRVDCIERVNNVLFKTDSLVGSFGLVEQCRDLKISILNLNNGSQIGDTSQTTVSKVAAVAKSTLASVNAFTDVANNFHDSGFISLGKAAPISSGVYAVTDIIGNVIDINEQVNCISDREKELKKTELSSKKRKMLTGKNFISKLNILRNTLGISGSIMAIASFVLGSSVAFTIIGLSLSTFWLATKIYAQYSSANLRFRNR